MYRFKYLKIIMIHLIDYNQNDSIQRVLELAMSKLSNVFELKNWNPCTPSALKYFYKQDNRYIAILIANGNIVTRNLDNTSQDVMSYIISLCTPMGNSLWLISWKDLKDSFIKI